MYYSNGNYEAFARPRKPADVDDKSAYIVGSGLAGLSAAAFMIRDGQMKGEKITILEEMGIAGGACDGVMDTTRGYVIRGGREMENHFECLWDLFRSIPSIETEGVSVLDEFYWLNKDDPNISKMRAIENRGHDTQGGKFGLSEKAVKEIMKLFFTKNENLYNKKITDVFTNEFFKSNFWLYWRTMFAFEDWHSALEMKLYIQRFIHHIGGLPDFSTLIFTKFNQYESLILPLVKYLTGNGVKFQYWTTVENVEFDITPEKKVAKRILWVRDGKQETVEIDDNTLVFVTNGSCTENSTFGDNDKVPALDSSVKGCWALWRNIAKQDPSFGNPDVYCTHTDLTNWESATVTTTNPGIIKKIEEISKRSAFTGKAVTGGIVTIRDSQWLMSYTVSRQPHFKAQKPGELVVWVYALFTDRPGNFVKKPMKDCTGMEIASEWLYHLGFNTGEIDRTAIEQTRTIPCMMPYITAFFMPRKLGDRPYIVPDKVKNFAFIGQFAETGRDTIFTTEYSVRTGMEAAYTLLNIDRGVPEVWGSVYDVRELLGSTSKMNDGKRPAIKLPFLMKKIVKCKVKDTVIEEMLDKYGIL